MQDDHSKGVNIQAKPNQAQIEPAHFNGKVLELFSGIGGDKCYQKSFYNISLFISTAHFNGKGCVQVSSELKRLVLSKFRR
jgi:hypothetical protein